MALIRRAEAKEVARSAVTLHLGDLQRQGDDLVAESRARAEMIVADARAERDRLIADAAEVGREDGYRRGYEDGLAKGREDGLAEALESTSAALSDLAERWGLALARFEESREAMVGEARIDVVRLAALFAEKVTKRVAALDHTIVEAQLEAVLRTAIRPTRLVIAVHPDDLPHAEHALPALLRRLAETEHAEIVSDEGLERGSCVATMGSGARIDASIATQIDRLVGALLPADTGGEA